MSRGQEAKKMSKPLFSSISRPSVMASMGIDAKKLWCGRSGDVTRGCAKSDEKCQVFSLTFFFLC